MQRQQQIIDSIIRIRSKSTQQEIPIVSRRVEYETAKYSSKKDLIWHVYLNDARMVKKSDMLVQYQCSDCNSPIEVCTTQFLRKLRAGRTACSQCNLDILNSKPGHNISKHRPPKPPIQSIQEKHQSSIAEFQTYPEEYQQSYFLNHLTSEDFDRLRPKIISICNGKYTNLQEFEYWSIYKVHNQMAFSSVLYHIPTNTIVKANQPIMKCDHCGQTWRAKLLERYKNCYKVMCVDCTLCNRTFKIRAMHNMQGEKIMYQSKPEKRFVEWCNHNALLVTNGPNIPYFWDGKDRTYKVDFQVGGYLIEIKDFHIWHKNQVASGKWGAKENAAIEWCKNNENIKGYRMMTPQNREEIEKLLLTDV
jgi:hypothetical protein